LQIALTALPTSLTLVTTVLSAIDIRPQDDISGLEAAAQQLHSPVELRCEFDVILNDVADKQEVNQVVNAISEAAAGRELHVCPLSITHIYFRMGKLK